LLKLRIVKENIILQFFETRKKEKNIEGLHHRQNLGLKVYYICEILLQMLVPYAKCLYLLALHHLVGENQPHMLLAVGGRGGRSDGVL
jgi:hypothetical protein